MPCQCLVSAHYTYGLFRQSMNRDGNGNLINTNGFLDTMLSFHTAMGNGTGQGQGT